MREYKLIYKSYLLRPLVNQYMGSQDGSTDQEEDEVKAMSHVLSNHGRDGWTVKNSGVIEDASTAERVIFRAPTRVRNKGRRRKKSLKMDRGKTYWPNRWLD